MNTLESYDIINPLGKTDKCSKFVIYDTGIPFVLHDVIAADEEYTLSFWIKAEAEGVLNVANATINVTTEWSKHELTFYAWAEDLGFLFSTFGTYYIYHPKLESGNKASDWTTAPEDLDYAITAKGEELGQVIVEQTESAKETANAYTDEKLKDYVDNDTFESLEKDVNARLDVLDENITINIETVTKRITEVNNELREDYNVMIKYFEFGENGLVIGLTDNPYKTRIDNDRYSMTMNDVEVLYFDGNGKGYIPDLTVDRAFDLLGLKFDKDANGNLNCEYNGG